MPKIGLGATITVNDGSGGAGSAQGAILDCINLNVPELEIQVLDSKRLNQADSMITKVQGMRDPSTFSFQYEFSTGKKTRLDVLLGQDRVFVITLPTDVGSAYSRTIPGFISANKMDQVAPDAIQTVTCSVQVTASMS